MTNQISKLRAVADFAEQHQLGDHILSVGHLAHGTIVQLYARDDESPIGLLLPWADAMDVKFIRLSDTGTSYHMYAVGEIEGAGTVQVLSITNKRESREITTAALSDGMTPIQLVRACMVTEDGAA